MPNNVDADFLSTTSHIPRPASAKPPNCKLELMRTINYFVTLTYECYKVHNK